MLINYNLHTDFFRSVIGDLFSPTSMFHPFNEIPGRIVLTKTAADAYNSMMFEAQNVSMNFDDLFVSNNVSRK